MIDQETSKTVKTSETLILQLRVYDPILEQNYHQVLKRISLIFVRAGEEINYSVTAQHMDQVRELINDLALRLKADQRWEPVVGQGCDRCSFQRYCSAKTSEPEPLPESAKAPPGVQLVLSL